MLKFKFLAMKQMILTMDKASTLVIGTVHCQTSLPADSLKRKLHDTVVDQTPKAIGGH